MNGYTASPSNPGVSENEAQKMQALPPRLIKGSQADYIPSQWPGENPSGLTPMGPNILVKMDECSSQTSGGIELPAAIVERMSLASVTGCIFGIGPDAFKGYLTKPVVGQRIYVDKYAGLEARGKDGKFYRLIDEKCIAAAVEDDLCVAEDVHISEAES